MNLRSLGLAFTLFLFGCASPALKNPTAGNLQLRNPAGQVVMTAEFEFPPEPLTSGKNFAGRWQPLEVAPSVPPAWRLDATGWARYHAEIAAEGMSVDLSLGSTNNNVYLLAPEQNGQFQGEWIYTTLTDSHARGTFTLRPHP